jgi:ABC-type multidrug transport system fused ATPase/permease subunit
VPTEVRIGRELARGHGALLAAVGVLALLSTAATLGLPMLVVRLIGAIQRGEDRTDWLLLIVGAGVAAAASSSLAGYLLARAGYELIFRLRTRLMDHTLAMRVLDVRREGQADLASRLSGDTMRIKAAVDVVPLQLPVALLTLVGSLVLMGVLDLVLLGLTVATFAVALGVVGLVVGLLRPRYAALQDRLGWLSEEYAAALDGTRPRCRPS